MAFLLMQPASVPPISALGPDALLEPMTEEEFFNSLSKKKTAIKTLLLDQVKNIEIYAITSVHTNWELILWIKSCSVE